jgi:hypothetical protein
LALTVLLILFMGLGGARSLAQLYVGSLTGVVTDASGAVIPNAKVALTDVQKGLTFTATTDPTGRYLLRDLAPSTYRLVIEASGFAKYVREGIILEVKQNASIDAQMVVGTTVQEVEVKAGAPLLATQDAVTGQEVDRTMMNDLPLVGRSAYDLAFLAPGVTQPALGDSAIPVLTPIQGSSGNNFISNGGRNITTDVLLDGVTSTATDYQVKYPVYMPSIDAIQEFKVEQNNFSADIGYSGGTVVNVILRSGTNKFHGTLYEFLRNSALDSNNWFNNASNLPIPPLRYNDFGGVIGGPIRKDKTFFFFDFEGSRRRTLTTYAAGVPSVAERTGDFGELCADNAGTFNAQGVCSSPQGQIWDPYSGVYTPSLGGPVRQTFVPFNNMITYQSAGAAVLNGTPLQLPAMPGNLINPVAKAMMSFYPAPNVAVGTAAYNPYDNWAGSGTGMYSDNRYDVRLDHRLSERTQVNGRFSSDWGFEQTPLCWDNALDPCSSGPVHPGSTSASINVTHNLSPNTLLSLTYGLTRGGWVQSGVVGLFPNFNPVTTLGMPAYILDAGVRTSPWATIGGGYLVAAANSLGQMGWDIANIERQTHDVLGSMDHIAGRHEIKAGAELRVSQNNTWLPCCPTGYFYADQFGSSQQPFAIGGDGMATFLTGTSTDGYGAYQFALAPAMTSRQIGGYALDNWKATTRLTVNFGIRYDVEVPETERHNKLNYFDPTLPSPLQVPGLPNLVGGDVFVTASQRRQVPIYPYEWQPRVGLAYRINSSTVLRAGYGVFYDMYSFAAGSPGYLPGEDGFQTNTPWVTTYQNNLATPGATLSNPWPNGLIVPTGSSLGALTNVGFSPSGPIRAWNTSPQSQTWSLGIQRELPGHVLIDANYVGTKGTHLIFSGFANLNFLGPSVEKLSPSGIANLESLVPNPFAGIITNLASPLSASTVPAWQLQLPSPQFSGGESLVEPPWANSFYNAFQLRVEKRMSQGLELLVTYTNSKSLDDSSTNGENWTFAGGFNHFQDPNRLYLERGLSEFDISQLLQLTYVYQLPVGHGKHWGGGWPGWENAILGGWQTNGILRFSTGQPVSLSLSGGTSLPTYGPQEPNLLASLKRAGGAESTWLNQYFANPQVAVVPTPFTLGTGPAVLPDVRGPGVRNANLSLFKEFPVSKLGEGSHLEFRLESFNALNHPQFCPPSGTANLPTFGEITCQSNVPREVQIGLKLYW